MSESEKHFICGIPLESLEALWTRIEPFLQPCTKIIVMWVLKNPVSPVPPTPENSFKPYATSQNLFKPVLNTFKVPRAVNRPPEV